VLASRQQLALHRQLPMHLVLLSLSLLLNSLLELELELQLAWQLAWQLQLQLQLAWQLQSHSVLELPQVYLFHHRDQRRRPDQLHQLSYLEPVE
jgi:hypothetical protein